MPLPCSVLALEQLIAETGECLGISLAHCRDAEGNLSSFRCVIVDCRISALLCCVPKRPGLVAHACYEACTLRTT